MEICVGMMGWQPETFWDSSLNEIFIAIDGFLEFNGANKERPMDKEELKSLMELYPDD